MEDEGAESDTTIKGKEKAVDDEDRGDEGNESDTTVKAKDDGRSFQHEEQDSPIDKPSWAWHVWAMEQRIRVEKNRWRLIRGNSRQPGDLQPVDWEEVEELLPTRSRTRFSSGSR